MPQYYNLSKFSDADGLMGTFRVTSDLMSGWLGVGIETVVFIVAVMLLMKNGEDANRSIFLASFYTLIVGIIFYLTKIVTNSLCIWVPALIYVITLALRWYNKY